MACGSAKRNNASDTTDSHVNQGVGCGMRVCRAHLWCASRVSSKATSAPLSTRQLLGTDRFGKSLLSRGTESAPTVRSLGSPRRLEDVREAALGRLRGCIVA